MEHAATASATLTPFAYAAALISIAALYQSAWFRARRNSSYKISRWRALAFHSGLVFVWIAFESRVALLEHQSLTAHMIGHLLLSGAAAPLLLLGNPFYVLEPSPKTVPASCASPMNAANSLSPAHVYRVLTNPLFCWSSSVAVLLFWHVPSIFALSMHHSPLHTLEKITFLVTGLLFWSPIIRQKQGPQPWPRWTMPLYLLFATLPCDILSAFLVFCDRVVYTSFHGAHARLFTSALADQQCAGALMWVVVTFLYLTPAVIITMNELRRDHRRNAPQLPTEAGLEEVS
jgi:cytochrome c oxidase assembly factor CtaG